MNVVGAYIWTRLLKGEGPDAIAKALDVYPNRIFVGAVLYGSATRHAGDGLAKTVPNERLVFRHSEAMEMAWREDAEEGVFCGADCVRVEAG